MRICRVSIILFDLYLVYKINSFKYFQNNNFEDTEVDVTNENGPQLNLEADQILRTYGEVLKGYFYLYNDNLCHNVDESTFKKYTFWLLYFISLKLNVI